MNNKTLFHIRKIEIPRSRLFNLVSVLFSSIIITSITFIIAWKIEKCNFYAINPAHF